MNKILILVFSIFLTVTSTVMAKDGEKSIKINDALISVGLGAGYYSIQMKDWNDYNKEWLEMVERDPVLVGEYTSHEKIKSNAPAVTIKAMNSVTPQIDLGLKAGYLKTNEGHTKVEEYWEDPYEVYRQKSNFFFRLIPVMGGVRYTSKQTDRLNLRGSFFIGKSFATMYLEREYVSFQEDDPDEAERGDYKQVSSGSNITFEILGGAEYIIEPNISVFLDLGYGFANIPEMEVKSTDDPSVSKGDKLTDLRGETLSFDFSGLRTEAGIKVSF